MNKIAATITALALAGTLAACGAPPTKAPDIEERAALKQTAAAKVEEPTEVDEPATVVEQPAADKHNINIDVLPDPDYSMIIATYTVPDSASRNLIVSSLKEGCYESIKQITNQVDGWADYDLIQCFGNLDGGPIQVGAANYTGATLANIDINTITPEQLWNKANHTSINEHYQ